ncbi:hypothetical protein V8G54_032052 [Vigna mungo]|uniref:Uncharacterized protein n=1 Tax=Vigna mungo TaxID=3915 RepID=A0AAQ3MKE9_VIGMU
MLKPNNSNLNSPFPPLVVLTLPYSDIIIPLYHSTSKNIIIPLYQPPTSIRLLKTCIIAKLGFFPSPRVAQFYLCFYLLPNENDQINSMTWTSVQCQPSHVGNVTY